MIEETPPEPLRRVGTLVLGGPPARWYRFRPEPWATEGWSVRCPCREVRSERVVAGIICRAREVQPYAQFGLPVHAGVCPRCAAGFWAANWGRLEDRRPEELDPEEAVLGDLFAETWPEARGVDPEPIRLRGLDPAWETGLAECRDCYPWYSGAGPGRGLSALIPLRRTTLRGPRGELAVLLGRCLRCDREFWGGRLHYSGPAPG